MRNDGRHSTIGCQEYNSTPSQIEDFRPWQIPLKASDLAYWDEKSGKFQVETEPVSLMIGASSADIKLDTTVQVK